MKADISSFVSNDRLRVIVKPNAKQNEVMSWDESRKALRIAIAAVPEKDRANVELLKFLKKLTGKKCTLFSGHKSREKLIELS
ncbi:YggU family protein [Candidatus Woesearchaeota archaeon]|nr:YggU family protein [Candidatus Woesearchaeota archaeon]